MSLDENVEAHRRTLLSKWDAKQPVLHGQGFIRIVDIMGGDGSIVEAARVTTGKGRSRHTWGEPRQPTPEEVTQAKRAYRAFDDEVPADFLSRNCAVCNLVDIWDAARDPIHLGICLEGDRRLLNYCMEHNHASPFDFAEFAVHIRCPMDVFRQWVRHWSWEFQEYSTRYSEAIDEKLVTPPTVWRKQATANRQGSAGFVTEWPKGYAIETSEVRGEAVRLLRTPLSATDGRPAPASPGEYLSFREAQLHALACEVYEERRAFGVANEQARKDLPLSNFTEVYCKASLRDLLHFLYLRTDGHAQWEIRQYADAIAKFVEAWVPLTWGAFVEHRRDAVTLSATQARAMQRILATVRVEQPDMLPAVVEVILNDEGIKGRARTDFFHKLALS